MKKFLLFGSNHYYSLLDRYSSGGIKDFITDGDTVDELKAVAMAVLPQMIARFDELGLGCDIWAQIVEHETLEIVLYGQSVKSISISYSYTHIPPAAPPQFE